MRVGLGRLPECQQELRDQKFVEDVVAGVTNPPRPVETNNVSRFAFGGEHLSEPACTSLAAKVNFRPKGGNAPRDGHAQVTKCLKFGKVTASGTIGSQVRAEASLDLTSDDKPVAINVRRKR